MMTTSITRRTILAAAALLGSLAIPWVARADDPPAASTLTYDDPAMHYQAPDGWTRRAVGGGPPSGDDPQVIAMWVKSFAHSDPRTITITVQNFQGDLDAAQSQMETQLRNAGSGGGGGGGDDDNGGGVFFDRKDKITLPNGMPARYLKVSTGSGAGAMARLYQYLVVDGKRMIVVTYAGRDGYFGDKDALDALSTLTVVLYPPGR
jgi:hypothetical protein